MILERYILNYLREFNALDRCEWNYEDGCVLIGAQAMYEATGNELYFDCMKTYIDRYVSQNGTIKNYNQEEYNVDRVPSGRVLYTLFAHTQDLRYRQAIENIMQQLRTHPRTDCGNFWHKKIYPHQIWLDGLYMALPFYMMYDNTYGSGESYADVVNQFENVRKLLFDETAALYYHGYDESRSVFWADEKTGLSANFWSRAMGWYVMALADCYDLMPAENHAQRESLRAIWVEALDGILRYQDAQSGLFYQLTALPDLEGNYLETSASCMIACSILKGCRLGVLDHTYQHKAEQILIGLETKMFAMEDGCLRFKNMCVGAGLGPAGNLRRDGSTAYYLSEPVVMDEQKGVGACMMCYAEWLKLCGQQPMQPEKTPKILIYNSGY